MIGHRIWRKKAWLRQPSSSTQQPVWIPVMEWKHFWESWRRWSTNRRNRLTTMGTGMSCLSCIQLREGTFVRTNRYFVQNRCLPTSLSLFAFTDGSAKATNLHQYHTSFEAGRHMQAGKRTPLAETQSLDDKCYSHDAWQRSATHVHITSRALDPPVWLLPGRLLSVVRWQSSAALWAQRTVRKIRIAAGTAADAGC